ncbi:NUDIX hydrolase [Anaerobutyricum hallii]|uniref:NUDIX hydrolase n=1 Tax=Anaerobutyricum hallii TaxID=39488 RepID=UPI002ED17E11
MSRNKWTDMIIELQGLSQAGLTYVRDDFDLERYARIRDIAAEVDSVIAIHDRERHNTPHYAYGVCKIFNLCHVTGGSFEKNIETTGFDWFAEDDLPPSCRCQEQRRAGAHVL